MEANIRVLLIRNSSSHSSLVVNTLELPCLAATLQDGIHARLHHLSNSVILFGKYHHQFFTISFHDFNFLLELSKMY